MASVGRRKTWYPLCMYPANDNIFDLHLHVIMVDVSPEYLRAKDSSRHGA